MTITVAEDRNSIDIESAARSIRLKQGVDRLVDFVFPFTR